MTTVRTSLSALLLLAAAACGSDQTGPADGHVAGENGDAVRTDRVEMHDDAFVPAVIEVPSGTTVTWAFTDDGRRHDVVGDGFASDVVGDGTFTHAFTEAGAHDYRCSLHRGMEGRVVVTQ